MTTMIKQFILAAFAALTLTAASSAQALGPTGQFQPMSSLPTMEEIFIGNTYAIATNGTALNGWFNSSALTPQQEAFLKATAGFEHRKTCPDPSAPGGINPDTANTIGDNGDSLGPLQIQKGYIYDSTEFNPGLGCRIDDLDPNGLGGQDGTINVANWMNVHYTGFWYWEGVSPDHRELSRKIWWDYSCGIAVNYFDRYCGSAWNDLNSSDPAVTAAAVNELSRTHNGGPGGPNYPSTEGYRDGVIGKLTEFFPGVIAGY